MLILNSTEIKKRKDELEQFKGFLPFQFDTYISLSKRKEFLVDQGLWDEVHEQELQVMKGIRDTKPNDDVYLDKVLRKWVVKNPEFEDLVI